MWLQIVSCLFVIAAATTFGQNPTSVKAGDLAPNLVGGNGISLIGQVTVLGFFPKVSANEKLVSRWNELVEKFSGQPVNFVLITSEASPAFDAWVEKHPVNGHLLLDPKQETAKAYGIEMSGGAVIGADGRIAGFTFMLPEEQQIQAVQEGRAVAIKGDASDAQMNEILAGRAVRLDAEPYRVPVPDGVPESSRKPDIAPSNEVHISLSSTKGTETSEGPDWLVQRGFDLRSILAQVWEKDANRIILPASLDEKNRYDFVLVSPREMDRDEARRLVRECIERYFRITATLEARPLDVYVMNAVKGKTPKAKTGDEGMGGGAISWSGSEFAIARPHSGTPPTIEEIRKMMDTMDPSPMGITQMSTSNSTMDDLRRTLEMALNRPIVDETGLTGTYDIEVQGNARDTDDFLKMLAEQQGILLTPNLRNVEMLVVRQLP